MIALRRYPTARETSRVNRNMALLSAAPPAEATSAVASLSLAVVPSARASRQHDHRPAIRPSRVVRSDRDARARARATTPAPPRRPTHASYRAAMRPSDPAIERSRHRDTATPPRNQDTERPRDRETERPKPRLGERGSEKRQVAVGRPGFRNPRRSWRSERGHARAAAAPLAGAVHWRASRGRLFVFTRTCAACAQVAAWDLGLRRGSWRWGASAVAAGVGISLRRNSPLRGVAPSAGCARAALECPVARACGTTAPDRASQVFGRWARCSRGGGSAPKSALHSHCAGLAASFFFSDRWS